jgi:aryl-alcohol dehydrogenase-like predicted oxidoreductase
VGIINASCLSMGLLTDTGPPEWHPAPLGLKAAAAKAAEVARAKGQNISELALMWAVQVSPCALRQRGRCCMMRPCALCQRGHCCMMLHLTLLVQEQRIATTLVGMATRDMVRRNVATVSRALSAPLIDAELAALDAIQRVCEDVRDVTWHSGRPENN